MVDTEDIGKLAIGLTIALVIIAYVAPIGIEALYDKDYRGWGWKHDGGDKYEYNETSDSWFKYNVTSGAYDIAASSREDKKTSALIKLLPLFAVLAIVVGVVLIVRDKMR